MKIGFGVNWDNNKEKTWSYTPYSLMTALHKRSDTTVYDWNLRPPLLIHNYHRAKNIYYNQYNKKFTTQYRNSISYHKVLERNLQNYEQKQMVDAIISIGDCGRTSTQHFAYADCSAQELMHLMQDPLYRPMYQTTYTKSKLQAKCAWQEMVLPSYKKIVTMSRHSIEYFHQTPGVRPEQMAIIPPGTNVDFQHHHTSLRPIDNPYILFVGKEFHMKAGSQVIEAFTIVKQKIPSLELVIIGPPEFERPETLANGIHWLGFVPKSELPQYFHHAEIFCVPSHIEAFGIVFAEALCYGLPVVARKAFAMQDIISNGITGNLIDKDATSGEELAEVILRTLDDSTMKQVVKRFAPVYQQYYSWERVADDFLRCINNKPLTPTLTIAV